MEPNDMKQRVEELLQDEAFISDLKKASSKKDLQEVFKKYGLTLDREEIDAFVALIESFSHSEDSLSEEQLDNVAGGRLPSVAVTPWSWFSVVYSVGKSIWEKAWEFGKKFSDWEDNLYSKKKTRKNE